MKSPSYNTNEESVTGSMEWEPAASSIKEAVAWTHLQGRVHHLMVNYLHYLTRLLYEYAMNEVKSRVR